MEMKNHFEMDTWTCHVCKAERPDDKIDVFKIDVDTALSARGVTVTQNVRYCNDRPECIAGARDVRFIT